MILFCLFEDVIILVCGDSKLKNRNAINKVLITQFEHGRQNGRTF